MSGVVKVRRVIKAPPATVFAAWTDPGQLRKWLAPDAASVGDAQCDPVVGGRYRIVKIFDEGADEVTGEYLVVDPPHRLVFTWRAGTTGPGTTQVTVTLHPHDDGTEMVITHEGLPALGIEAGARSAWTVMAAKLADHLTAPS